MHNLFGDTNAVHVTVDEKGYNIEQVIDGETVAEVLDYVQYNPKKLAILPSESQVMSCKVAVRSGRSSNRWIGMIGKI